MTKVVIIGGVASGSKAAFKLKRLKPNFDITIYTKEHNVSYSACGMPYYIGGIIKDIEKLIIRKVDDFKKSGIDVKNLHEVLKIIPEQKRLLIRDLKTGSEFFDNYDKLIIATGAGPFMPDIKGIDLGNIFTLRNLNDGRKIKKKLLHSERALIIGGNYIGVELAESFIRHNVTTTIVEQNSHIMRFFDDDMGNLIQNTIKNISDDYLKIINSDRVIEFKKTENNDIEVITENGFRTVADFVIIAAGVRPCVRLAVEAGVELGESGAIKVDNKMKTNIEDIWAIGDCAEKLHLISKKNIFAPLSSIANKEGRICALNIAGKEAKTFNGIIGSSVVKYFDFSMSKSGLADFEAKKLGFEPVSVVITNLDKSKYMPEAKEITIKLTADKNTHKLLGVQCIGFGDADKRVNILATALLKEFTVEELVNIDLTYSPPVSISIDPILIATYKLIEKLEN